MKFQPKCLRGEGVRLGLALLVSLLLHVWWVSDFRFSLPETPHQQPLLVSLVPPTLAVKPEIAQGPAPATPAPTRSHPAHPAHPARPARPAIAAPPTPVEPMDAAPPAPPTPESQPQATTVAESAPPDQQVLVPSELLAAAAGEEPLPQTPRLVEIDFEAKRKGDVVGALHHRYQAAEDGSYGIKSVVEPHGVLSLFISKLVETSSGRLTAHGLRPDSYTYQYGNSTEKSRKASFDWAARQLTIETKGQRKTEALQDGAQDMLSFIYQFMFVPPLSEMQLAITNGKSLKVYDYDFEGEETLETKLGPLLTWHVGRASGEGEEKKELWLAVDHYYLPARIRITDKQGTVMEGTVTRLRTE